MDKGSKKFLKDYLNTSSPTGFESAGQRKWLDYVSPFIDDHFVDTYGSAVGVINPKSKYKVVIEAHADEISWFVNYIDSNGYIYVIRNGGSDHQIAPSKRVNIKTDSGKVVKGVFGWPAIHVRRAGSEQSPSLKNIFIDIGAESAAEVEKLGVKVGNVITFEDEMFSMNKKFCVGRALDNRIGGFMIAEVAKRLSENKVKLPFGLYVVNAVQEEIGLRGAQMIAERIKPNVAIVTDVTHDTQSPMYNKKEQGDIKCGGGPVLTFGPAVQNNVLKQLFNVADNADIPYQRAATSRSTGTDTDAFAYSNEGVASALISLPLKYMHTTVETAKYDDIEHVIQLIYEFLLSLDGKDDFKYL